MRAGAWALLLVCAFAAPVVARAETVTLMVGGLDKQIYLPAILAQRLGYFAQEGVVVQLLDEPAGVEAEDELLAGAVQGVVGFYDHTVDLQAKGKFVETVVQLARAPGEVQLASSRHSEIAGPGDLKGRTVGVTGLGSSTDFLTRYLIAKAGLKPGEVSVLPVGAGDTFIAAIKQDKIQAGMTTEPTISRLEAMALAKPIVDLRTVERTQEVLGGLYPGASLYMDAAYVEAHRDTVQRLVNAFVKTLRFVAGHSAGEVADKAPAEFFAGDRDLYVRGLETGKAMFTPDGFMPPGGPETVLAVLTAFSPSLKGKSIDLGKTYTNTFAEAARAAGVGAK